MHRHPVDAAGTLWYPCGVKRTRMMGLLAWAALLVAGVRAEPALSPVRVDFFREPGCADCAYVEAHVLPDLTARYEGQFDLIERDLNAESNYVALVATEERFKRRANATVYLLVDNRTLLAGVAEIEAGADRALVTAIAARQAGEVPGGLVVPPADAAVARRYADFTLGAVVLAGLADGLNICAITTLVFFMSVLAQVGASRRTRLALGLTFAGASYVTYFVIGLGLLEALHALRGFLVVRRVIELATVGVLVVLALLSFRDAWRYAHTGRAADVSLQLPAGIKRRIHTVLRRSVTVSSVVGAGLVAGVLVTVLEGVCSGQTYAPTLVLMGREGRYAAWGLLALYNALFVMPLLVVLALVSFGLKTEQLTDWTRKHVVPSKLLLGVVFLLLAAALLVLRRLV
jgi:hypothetical protein